MSEKLRELIAKARREAEELMTKNADINVRLARGETVTIESQPWPAKIKACVDADELEAALIASEPGLADARCNFYFGGIDGGNRCQKPSGHFETDNSHEWRADHEPLARPATAKEEEGADGH